MHIQKIMTAIITATLLGSASASGVAAPPADPAPPATSPNPVDDSMITAKVKAALSTDKSVSGASIQIKTENGIVTLAGTAPDTGTVNRILSVVSAVEGVKDIRNQLQVKAE